MPGYNLHTYAAMYRRKAQDATLNRESDQQITDTEIVVDLLESLLGIQNRKAIDLIRENTYDLVSGQSDYLLSTSRLGQNIEVVRCFGSSDAQYARPLQYLKNDQFQSYFLAAEPLDTPGPLVSTGSPQFWTMSRADGTKILIGPAPNFSRSNALILEYPHIQPIMSRVYNQSAVTATTTSGSGVIELSAIVDRDEIQIGDEFGVCPTRQFDGSPTAQDTPRDWYTIYAINDVDSKTYLTVIPEFNAGGGSTTRVAQRFITAQVPLIEQHYPGSLGYSPVYFALAARFAKEEPQAAAYFTQQGELWLSQAQIRSTGVELPAQTLNPGNYSWNCWQGQYGGFGNGYGGPWTRGN